MRLKNLMRAGEQKHNSSEQGPYETLELAFNFIIMISLELSLNHQ